MTYVLIYKRGRAYSATLIHRVNSVAEAKAQGLQHIERWNNVLRFIGHYTFIDILEMPIGGEESVIKYIQNLERQGAKEVQSVLHVKR